jgi:hypothetical protein
MALAVISVTGTFQDSSGFALSGAVLFTPTSTVTDANDQIIVGNTAVVGTLDGGVLDIPSLVCTDNPDLQPPGWGYTVNVAVAGAVQTFTTYLPSAYGASIDISQLIPAPVPPYLPNQLVAGVTVSGYPAAGQTIIADTATTAHWGTP